MSKKHGVEKIKKALGFIIELGDNVSKALKDGKYSFAEIFGTALVAKEVVPIIKESKELYAELKDLDLEEKHDIEKWAKNKFDIPNDKLEKKIEKGFNVLISIADFGGTFAKDEILEDNNTNEPEA